MCAFHEEPLLAPRIGPHRSHPPTAQAFPPRTAIARAVVIRPSGKRSLCAPIARSKSRTHNLSIEGIRLISAPRQARSPGAPSSSAMASGRACALLMGSAMSSVARGSGNALAHAASTSATTSLGLKWSAQQTRSGISVPVHGGNVDKALRMLNRRLNESNINDMWKKSQTFTPPTVKRKLQAKETAKRLSRQAFNAKLNWILQRKERYVGCEDTGAERRVRRSRDSAGQRWRCSVVRLGGTTVCWSSVWR